MLQFPWGGVRIIDWIFPPGHILQTTNENYNPNKVFKGTTWTRIKDRFLLSAGDAYSAGSTGGEASHTLTVDEMPKHSHEYPYMTNWDGVTSSGFLITSTAAGSNGQHTNTAGGSQPHNNMPPYLTVYTWQRIS